MPSTKFDMKLGPPRALALLRSALLLPIDKARHAGEAVAMVVARTQDEALDAAELVDVHYEPLPAVTHARGGARAGRARSSGTKRRDNVLIDTTFGDAAATERAFAAAAHVVGMDFHVPRVTACPLEPRAALGLYHDGRYTLGRRAAARCDIGAISPARSACRPSPARGHRRRGRQTSARETAPMSNTAWCSGRRASSLAR
jgi:carbon-monoxide dehydrogenase large subunit